MSNNPLPVRSPLDMLRLDFPDYQITMRTICGKLFYLAEAADPARPAPVRPGRNHRTAPRRNCKPHPAVHPGGGADHSPGV